MTQINRCRSIKIGATVRIGGNSFPLTGLPDSAQGELIVDEYGENWMGRYTLECVNSDGDRFNVMESELIVIRD